MYRTGDLARWLPEGQLEFLGRNDFQVKVLGVRVELGEVEDRLLACDGVSEVVVTAREDRPGDQRLVAYYSGERAPEPEVLRAHARAGLPEYMVPSLYVKLPSLPLSPSGKVDRRALPAPTYASLEFVAPRTEREKHIAEAVAELLGVPRVGVSDNLFLLGAHSLLATKLVSRLQRTFGVEIPLRLVFDHPVIGALAAAIDELAARSAPDEPAARPIRRLSRDAYLMPSEPAEDPVSGDSNS
jgi:acyl carrier protein